jgi:ribosomal protein S8
MKKRHLVSLIRIIKDSLSAHKNADWSDRKVVEIVAENITNKFARYMKEQEGLEKLGKTEEDYMIPPGGLNR